MAAGASLRPGSSPAGDDDGKVVTVSGLVDFDSETLRVWKEGEFKGAFNSDYERECFLYDHPYPGFGNPQSGQ